MSADLNSSKQELLGVEQLRLLLGHAHSTVIPLFLLSGLMVAILADGKKTPALLIWFVALAISKLNVYRIARKLLASEIRVTHVSRHIRHLAVLHGIEGALWGALTWIAIDPTTSANSVVVLAVVVGVVSCTPWPMAPAMPVFSSFVIMETLVIASRTFTLPDPILNALGFAFVLYVFALYGQALNATKIIRASIEHRFENLDLLRRLQTETVKAEEANQAKSRFLAAASHDLRQPVHALGLYLDALGRSDLTDQQRKTLESACSVSEATAEILNTLLDFSRLEAGVVSAHTRSFHLQPLLNKIQNELAPQADTQGLIYRSRDTHLAVQSDPILLKLVLRNLVSNAIRYTQTGGVLVGCRLRGDRVLIEVWDTGIGIPPAQQQEIFREFHQLGNPERDRRKGLGLGLAIVERLCALLEHPVSLSSRPQRGSVFRLSLPIAKTAVASSEFETIQVSARNLNAKVLLIDDDATVLDGMQDLLRSWGCHCRGVESIEQALLAIKEFQPDIVISDYRLREQRTGAEAIQAVRHACGRMLPAMLITGDTAPERIREATASGIPLLHKPVSSAQLNQRLIDLLATR